MCCEVPLINVTTYNVIVNHERIFGKRVKYGKFVILDNNSNKNKVFLMRRK